MRIRGKSNNIEVCEGSLRKTMYEQHKKLNIRKKRQSERKKIKKLERIERYREERLLKELRMLEEEKRLIQKEQK